MYMAQFDEKHFFDPNDKFFVTFIKTASKQQKSIMYLYVAHFDEKNTFLN